MPDPGEPLGPGATRLKGHRVLVVSVPSLGSRWAYSLPFGGFSRYPEKSFRAPGKPFSTSERLLDSLFPFVAPKSRPKRSGTRLVPSNPCTHLPTCVVVLFSLFKLKPRFHPVDLRESGYVPRYRRSSSQPRLPNPRYPTSRASESQNNRRKEQSSSPAPSEPHPFPF